jgi:nucleoside-diphosphate-sugar epimerase
MADVHAVLGATGGVGAALTAELVRRGHAVRAVSRSGRSAVPGADPVAADLTDPAALAAALEGAAVVHHAAQPAYTRWPEEFPAMTRRVVDATAAAGARLVVVDNLYMYGPVPGGYGPGTPHGPLIEGTPERATGRKGAVRAAMSRDLLQAHRSGRLSVTIGRLADYHGPGGLNSSVGERLFAGALAGRPAQWLGGLDHPHSFTYLPDAARALATLADQPDAASGRVWHLPVAPPVTPRDFIRLVNEAAGVPDRVRVVPAWVVAAAGRVIPIARELAELAYQVDRPFVVDDSRYRAEFGDVEPTPHADAVGATLAWFTERARRRPVTAIPA